MIQVEKLIMAYGGQEILDEVSFCLSPGERCGLLGRNGSGKTTLLRLLTGEEKPESGKISIPKDYTIGYLNQHIRFTQPSILEEATLGLKEEERDQLYRVEKMLFGLGFNKEQLTLAPSQFSGGYHLRLHLAKVLLSEPNCLLLDEPTNYLDIVAIRFLARFLRAWDGEFLLITHDREFMDSVTTHMLGIHRKKVRKIKGSSTDYFTQILEEERLHERTRINVGKKEEKLKAFIDRFGAKASKAGQAQSKQKLLERLPVLEELKAIYSLDFNFKEAPYFGTKMVEANALTFGYDTTQPPLIKDFSFTIDKGDRIAVIGKNGRGKSTLLRLLAKELDAQSGTIRHYDNVRLGFFAQTHMNLLHATDSVEEAIASKNRELSYGEVRAICGLMMFTRDLAKKKISVLSGGERSRVLLGQIVAMPSNLLFLDEPTHHLDIESIEALIDALEEFEGSMVMATHSELILRRMRVNKIIICHEGSQKIFLGDYDEFLDKVGWQDENESAKPEKKENSWQEEKRRRAELVQQRSKKLKPLMTEIKRAEEEIKQLDAMQKRDHALVIEVSEKNPPALGALVKEIGERDKKMAELYLKLDRLHFDYAKAEAEFER